MKTTIVVMAARRAVACGTIEDDSWTRMTIAITGAAAAIGTATIAAGSSMRTTVTGIHRGAMVAGMAIRKGIRWPRGVALTVIRKMTATMAGGKGGPMTTTTGGEVAAAGMEIHAGIRKRPGAAGRNGKAIMAGVITTATTIAADRVAAPAMAAGMAILKGIRMPQGAAGGTASSIGLYEREGGGPPSLARLGLASF